MPKATASKPKTNKNIATKGRELERGPVFEIELVPFDTFITRLKSRTETALKKVAEARKVIAEAHPYNLPHEIEWNINTLMFETEIAGLANNFLEIEGKDNKYSVAVPVEYTTFDAAYKADYMRDVYKTYSEIILRGKNPVGHYELRKKHYGSALQEVIKLMMKFPGL